MSYTSNAKRGEKDTARDFVGMAFAPEDVEQRQKLLETLDHSMVALRIAATYIMRMKENPPGCAQNYKISDYLMACEHMESELSDLGPSLEDEPKFRAISLALLVTLDWIGNGTKGEEVNEISELLAFVAHDKPIPVELLRKLMPSKPANIDETLQLLVSYAVLSSKPDDGTYRIIYHVQKALRAISKKSEKDTLDKSLEVIAGNEMNPNFVGNYVSIWDCASDYGVLVRKYHKDIIGKVMNLMNKHVRDKEQTHRFRTRQIEVLEKHLGRNNEELLKLKGNQSAPNVHKGAGGGARLEVIRPFNHRNSRSNGRQENLFASLMLDGLRMFYTEMSRMHLSELDANRRNKPNQYHSQ